MEQFGSDDGSNVGFLNELASLTANLNACSEVEREYLRVRARILDQQKCLEGWFQHMLVPRPGDETPQNFNQVMMQQPQLPMQAMRSQSNKYSKYSDASSGTQTPSTCSGSSDLSRSSDHSSQQPPGLRNWEPSEQERQFLLDQIQEVLLARNPQQPGMGGRMMSPMGTADSPPFQHSQSPMHAWTMDGAPQAASANLKPDNMQPQKVPVMGSHRTPGGLQSHGLGSRLPYLGQDSFPPPFPPDLSAMVNPGAPGEHPAVAPSAASVLTQLTPGSLEHMQMLSKIAELQQQLNEQQKLLEVATQGSGCPTIQAVPEMQVVKGKGKGSGGYHRSVPQGPELGLQKKGPNMVKDNNKNDKNGKLTDMQLANSATLQTHLKALGNEDPACIFIVRKVNRLGFRSVDMLTKFFSQHDTVVKVLVAHSKVKRNQGGNAELYLRPGSLGFVLMKSPEAVQRILATGPTISVQGTPIRVQPFSRLNSGVSGSVADDETNEDVSVIEETST